MEEKKNIVLIGMPGSGKSTIGVILAKALGMGFVDIDLLICQREGCTLQEILDERGLDAFLQVEEDTVLEMDQRGTVIATGGSVPMRRASMEHLARSGVFVYIDVPLEELERRIHDMATRGIAFGPGQTLADIYAVRTPIYRRWADATVTVAPGGGAASESMSAPAPVTVHWLDGVRRAPYSSGKRNCRSAVQKCEPVRAATFPAPPPSIITAARQSASAMVEQAP